MRTFAEPPASKRQLSRILPCDEETTEQRFHKLSEKLDLVLCSVNDLSGHVARLADKMSDICNRLDEKKKERVVPSDPANGIV